MPRIRVTGAGSWGYAERAYRFGVHEVDEATATAAELDALDWVNVERDDSAPLDEPELPAPFPGPLSLSDLHLEVYANLAEPAGAQAPASEPAPVGALEFPCRACERSFPGKAARGRHESVKHPELKGRAGGTS